uniref:YopX protein n=1 Tax=Siphoviridae sp. ctr8v12 TaxID=2825685 RepID=A0A8S5QF85_9CAUD|nr:MAG TPA: YopX protein [Siphoviridae sp. ctr8v12]
MSREIKFRGKRVKMDDPLERWIEGSCVEYTNIRDEKVVRIMSKSGYQNEVYPETVGQFTGLYDKNDKEIYESDILRFYHNNEEYICVVGWNYEVGAWCIRFKDEVYVGTRPLGLWLCDYKLEIIGNIYDNK